jgi:hypothetical protein
MKVVPVKSSATRMITYRDRCIRPVLTSPDAERAYEILTILLSSCNFFDTYRLNTWLEDDWQIGFAEVDTDSMRIIYPVHFRDYYTALKPFQVTFKGEPCSQP